MDCLYLECTFINIKYILSFLIGLSLYSNIVIFYVKSVMLCILNLPINLL